MARPLKRKWEVGNDQCRIKVGAIDAAALVPLQETGARPRTRKKESLLYICAPISLVGTISGKSLKLLLPDAIF